MIEIRINPACVQRVHIVADSELEQDLDHAAWLTIRPLVRQIDRRLRATIKEALREQQACAASTSSVHGHAKVHKETVEGVG